jgi:AcrR family transcriptional regulator
MDGLAERAGLGKGTVFRRFGTQAAPQVSERLGRGWQDLIQRVCRPR